MNTVVSFCKNLSELTLISLCCLFFAVTVDREMVHAPVTQGTHIIIPSSLQAERIVWINHSVILATGLFWVLHVPSHVFPSGAGARHRNYSNKPEFYKDKSISVNYWRFTVVHSSPQGHRTCATFWWLLANWFFRVSHGAFRKISEDKFNWKSSCIGKFPENVQS